MALTEFMHCPEIPVKVTINEYLEITKNYSTPNSSKFVNGIMDKLRIDLAKMIAFKNQVEDCSKAYFS